MSAPLEFAERIWLDGIRKAAKKKAEERRTGQSSTAREEDGTAVRKEG